MNLKKQKGITLIALVVTVVVLIIIASISIAIIRGDNGIINQAGNAKEDTEIAEEIELIEVSAVKAVGKDENGKLKHDLFESELDKKIKDEMEREYSLEPNTDAELYKVTYLDTNRSYFVNGNGEVLKGDIPSDSEDSELEYFDFKIEINTELASYNETFGTIPIIYNIIGVYNGEIVYEQLECVNFNSVGSQTSSIEVNAPVGTNLTVTQVYSGAGYKTVSELAQSVELVSEMVESTDAVATFSYTNEYDYKNISNGGSTTQSIIYTRETSNGTWNYVTE